MKVDHSDTIFKLNEVEVETVRRAASARGSAFDSKKRMYTAAELDDYGIVREAYHSEELDSFGVDRNSIVTSHDITCISAREMLRIDAPFGGDCVKWQLPIDMREGRTFITEFAPGTVVTPHVHPANSSDDPGGSLRTVLKGALNYAGRRYEPGDWFYIPNGVPYSFRSDSDNLTTVMYTYAFFGVSENNRLSAPEDMLKHGSLHQHAA